MTRFAFLLKQFRLEDEGLKPRNGQSISSRMASFDDPEIAKQQTGRASGLSSSGRKRFQVTDSLTGEVFGEPRLARATGAHFPPAGTVDRKAIRRAHPARKSSERI